MTNASLISRVAVVGLAAATAVAGDKSCLLTGFQPGSFPANANFTAALFGSQLPLNLSEIQGFLFEVDNRTSSVEVFLEDTNSPEKLRFYVSENQSLYEGKIYGIKLTNRSTAATLCSLTWPPAFIHGTYNITDVLGIDGNQKMRHNVAGKEELTIIGSNIFFPARHSDVLVRYADQNGNSIGLDFVQGVVEAVDGKYVVRSTTPSIPKPLDWFAFCPDKLNPTKSETCVPDISLMLSVSLDGGISFSNPIKIFFGYLPPIKVGFIFQSPVNDFGWTMALNEARNLLEQRFGSRINASTYFERIPEGEFESLQADIGETFRTGTLVPEFVDNGKRTNNYYPAILKMKQMCDEDFDLVVAGSFGYTSQAYDISEYYTGCQKVGNGSTSNEVHDTYFLTTAGYRLGSRLSNAFAKIYQMRFLAGMTAGYQMLEKKAEWTAMGKNWTSCVGYIGVFPMPETQRGINAFLLGCREVFPECTVKVVWTGIWHDPELDVAAASFLWNVGKCEFFTQHSDTLEPQMYYRDMGGSTFGYNNDARSLIGDSVLISSQLKWEPVFSYLIDKVRRKHWDTEDIWLGADTGAVSLSPFFSPRVSDDIQRKVLEKKGVLEKLDGNDAFKSIFCGSEMKKRWVYKTVKGGNKRIKGCQYQPEWERLKQSVQINRKHFRDENGNEIPNDQPLSNTGCLYGINYAGEALLADAFPNSTDPLIVDEDLVFNDYLLDGVELFEPQKTLYGTIHSGTSFGCTSGHVTLGDRFFVAAKEYPMCDGKHWRHFRGKCDPKSQKSEVVYEWLKDVNGDNLLCGKDIDPSGKYSTVADLPYLEHGPACDFVPWKSSTSSICIAVAMLGVVFQLSVIFIIWWYRNLKDVKSMQPHSVMWMAMGGIMLNVSTFFFIGESTNLSCLQRIWVFNVSFDAVFAFLWARIYRVFVLFSSTKRMKRVVVSERAMVKVALSIILIDIFILIAWTLVDPPIPVVLRKVLIELPEPGLGDLVFVGCSSKSGMLMSASLTFKVVLILSACYLVFASKNIPSSYVEHKFIIFGTYNTALFSLIVLLATMMTSDSPATLAVIQSIGVALGSMIVIGSIAIPRYAVALGRLKISPSSSTTIAFVDSNSCPGTITSSV